MLRLLLPFAWKMRDVTCPCRQLTLYLRELQLRILASAKPSLALQADI